MHIDIALSHASAAVTAVERASTTLFDGMRGVVKYSYLRSEAVWCRGHDVGDLRTPGIQALHDLGVAAKLLDEIVEAGDLTGVHDAAAAAANVRAARSSVTGLSDLIGRRLSEPEAEHWERYRGSVREEVPAALDAVQKLVRQLEVQGDWHLVDASVDAHVAAIKEMSAEIFSAAGERAAQQVTPAPHRLAEAVT